MSRFRRLFVFLLICTVSLTAALAEPERLDLYGFLTRHESLRTEQDGFSRADLPWFSAAMCTEAAKDATDAIISGPSQ